MSGWFDILSFEFEGPEDETGILKSRDEVTRLIDQEVKDGTPANRIVVGGFSQGGAMSLATGLTTEHDLAGITVLSGWFAIKEKVKDLLKSHATTVPIFWGHGVDDHLVSLSLGKLSMEELRKVGVDKAEEPGKPGVSFNMYSGLGHSASEQEIEDWASWLKKVLPQN